mmetsp:Transcript_18566/g.26405  ORF Transcript_18566/g.26405 Transcript_18566/m.26405 type:complete len:624 (+) Transcript_18566:132-2003(+)|eukprot:CAMPEP_0201690440 /NCGR_PEP_ID=MMETSP0578-20130828/3876_1 /ASSEMBLY_ACC=CAM_ASM_000663 /TAXON_ID=267565 /ORGANISM="Skeletonema grethea, Strain CCMP 1804" /LENGTH=623 /DNA_ID=CAMNT_0048175437 /DNA_START=87 /DNA_END=1958 /DNA_ORIENTATION=-
MSDRYAIHKAISKTAIDSLHAKLSAVDAGWLSNNSSSLLDGYTQILEQMHDGIEGTQSKRRRQTPLVNAGYAARMAVMTFILEKWFDSVLSRRENDVGINVVVLGCGLDAVGLWSRNVLDDTLTKYQQCAEDQTPKLNVYEFDAWDNCVLKQHALERSGIVQVRRTTSNTDDESAQESSFCVLMEGTINKATGKDDQSDYHLIAMDFRHICKDNYLLKNALDSTGFDPAQPTIILSELVLAYIGYESTNAILQSMARHLLRDNEHSVFFCLEPMLPTRTEQHHSTNEKQLLSVKESYARDYANQFLGKLNRGNSCSSSDDDDVFHPLGSSREAIIARFVSCGFSISNIDAASLRKAVADVSRTRRLVAKEPFDEHVALALNLECYAVACASGRSSDGDLGRLLPWLDQSMRNSSSSIRIFPIEDSSQDTLVGNLYGRIYTHLYDKHPAIRKMVKSALKTDLLADSTNGSSAIQSRFKVKGGKFWIALEVESSDVVGCIGVRQRKINEYDDQGDTEGFSSAVSVVEYEVQRLAVDDKHRGKGIGKRLLNAVHEYSLQQGSSVTNDMEIVEQKRNGLSVKLFAVTPDVLVNANNLYNAFGFVKKESFEGGLTMNVYYKTCYYYSG